jgi:predicted nucleic acid-binding Zn ribbon protein
MPRKQRPTDSSQRPTDDPEPLKEILARLFLSRGWGQRQDRLRLEEAWRQAVGEVAAEQTQLGALRRGVLEVLVRDAVLLQELAHFQKRQLVAALQQSLGPTRVTELRFRLGAWDTQKEAR